MSRRFRHARSATLAALLALTLAAATGSDSAPVATDACGDPVAERDVAVTPWTDLCALSITTEQVASSSGTGDPVTELQVSLELVSADRVTPSMLRLGWEADGCDVRIVLGDETPEQEAISAIGSVCGDDGGPYTDCLVREQLPTGETPAVCKQGIETVDIAPPTVEDGTYTWRIRVEGEVAEVVGDHAPGTELVVASSTAGPRVFATSNSAVTVLCVSDGSDRACLTSGGDVMTSDAVVTVTDS